MNAYDTLTVHQLLGRMVYFHALFIEPVLTPAVRPARRSEWCCRHGQQDLVADGAAPALRDTAWAVVAEIAATLPADTCPGEARRCCPTCRVLTAGIAIAECWLDVEHGAFGPLSMPPGARGCWGRAVAVQLAAAFASQHGSVCTALQRATATSSIVPPPSPERLPLTSELMVLWADPTDDAPVASWLNHCTGLTDIAKVLHTRRTSR